MTAKVNEETCTGCGACVEVCPVDAIKMEEGKAVVNSEECIDCGSCVGECPVEAISMEE
jgi:Fe-S-cluster-containing hydrogenase component 2